jgi:hypothetical protein
VYFLERRGEVGALDTTMRCQHDKAFSTCVYPAFFLV